MDQYLKQKRHDFYMDCAASQKCHAQHISKSGPLFGACWTYKLKHACLTRPFIKEATQKGQSKEHCMLIKPKQNISSQSFLRHPSPASNLFNLYGKIQRKAEMFLRFAQFCNFVFVIRVNISFQCLEISTGLLSFLSHLKNATGLLSFLAKIVLSYWIWGVFSSLSFFNFGQKKSLVYVWDQRSREILLGICWINKSTY